MGTWLIPLAGLVLGLTLGHWFAIPIVTLVWFVGFVLLAVLGWESGGAMADFGLAVAMLPASYVAAAVGVAIRRLFRRRAVAASDPTP